VSAPPTASTSLIQRLKANDEEAWQRLVHLYVPMVFAWCRQCGLQDPDGADIVQEVFRSVMRGIGQFRGGHANATFRGWLKTITRNKIRDHFRAGARAPAAAGGTDAQRRWMDLPDDDEGPEDSKPLSALLRRALDLIRNEFEDRTWRAFWMTTIEEQPATEVARQLQISPAAARQAKYRVLRRLRQEVGDAE
jgi:RNA polymerase sigma-70 factor (ECF subfamily)